MADMEVVKVADMAVDKLADKVADMMANIRADTELDMVADVVVDKVADMKVDMVADINININMEIQFGERVGHGGCLIGPRRFRPQVYPYCASFKLCEFILFQILPILLELEFKSISFPSQLRNTNRYPLKQMLPAQ